MHTREVHKVFKAVLSVWTKRTRDTQNENKTPPNPKASRFPTFNRQDTDWESDKTLTTSYGKDRTSQRAGSRAVENNILGHQSQKARPRPNGGIFPAFRGGEPENRCLAGFQTPKAQDCCVPLIPFRFEWECLLRLSCLSHRCMVMLGRRSLAHPHTRGR